MGNTVGSQKKFSRFQLSILIGMLLGDGCLEKNGINVRLRVEHGSKQKDYLWWKYKQFINLATDKPRLISVTRFGKIHRSWRFSTFSLPELNKFRDDFYYDRKKRIPKKISELLRSPLALAVWYMDDGYKRNDCNAFRLNTDNFNLKEQMVLRRILKLNFGVEGKVHKKGKFYNIYIPKSQSVKFYKIVKPYIVPSLKYKASLTP